MIRNDPVTCARYYRNRICALRSLILHDNKYYGDIQDFFFVTEFQNRRSEHDHALLWVKDAPIYGKNADQEIEDFIDKYLTCDSTSIADSLRTLHHHHHTKSCRKRKKLHCRFNFPQPPMKKTRILKPLEYDNEKTKENANLIFGTIQNSKYDSTYTFDDFLKDLGLTNDEYIHAIQCSLNRTTVLLERRPSETWTNSFSRHVANIWNANIDSQFIVDSFATAMYCSSYMTKFDRTITSTFKRIREEHKKSDVSVIKTISNLGKALVNMQQMSAQQAVHIILSLPLNTSSRNCIFVNTSPIEHRAFVLKKKRN